MQFKVGTAKPTGMIKMIISTQPMAGLASEDGMTEISGVSGLTSDAGGASSRREEQDLKGEDNGLWIGKGGDSNSREEQDARWGTVGGKEELIVQVMGISWDQRVSRYR